VLGDGGTIIIQDFDRYQVLRMRSVPVDAHRAMAKAGRDQRMHGRPREIGSAVLRSCESPGSGDAS
jgi:hypothetical protein